MRLQSSYQLGLRFSQDLPGDAGSASKLSPMSGQPHDMAIGLPQNENEKKRGEERGRQGDREEGREGERERARERNIKMEAAM
jgi:hypothetical protein